MIATVLVAFVTAVVATAVCRWVARRWGIVNRPNPIVAQHVTPIPYLGGVGVTLAVLVAWFLASPALPVRAMLLPTLAFLALGVADDLKAFSPGPKFALQVGAALLAVASGTSFALGHGRALDIGASAFCILVFVNAFNFIDVADGLATGLSLLFFAFAAQLSPESAAIAWPAAAASAGFLVWNRPRASIFLGDAGSHVLGFFAAIVLIRASNADPTWLRPSAIVMTAGMFLFETVFITAVRIHKGLPWWRGSPDHVALRLQAAGLSTWQTDFVLWAAAAVLGLCAWTFAHAPMTGRLLVPSALVVVAFGAARALLSLETSIIRHRSSRIPPGTD